MVLVKSTLKFQLEIVVFQNEILIVVYSMKVALCIAIRYSASRAQFGLKNKPENPGKIIFLFYN